MGVFINGIAELILHCVIIIVVPKMCSCMHLLSQNLGSLVIMYILNLYLIYTTESVLDRWPIEIEIEKGSYKFLCNVTLESSTFLRNSIYGYPSKVQYLWQPSCDAYILLSFCFGPKCNVEYCFRHGLKFPCIVELADLCFVINLAILCCHIPLFTS